MVLILGGGNVTVRGCPLEGSESNGLRGLRFRAYTAPPNSFSGKNELREVLQNETHFCKHKSPPTPMHHQTNSKFRTLILVTVGKLCHLFYYCYCYYCYYLYCNYYYSYDNECMPSCCKDESCTSASPTLLVLTSHAHARVCPHVVVRREA